MYQDFNFRNGQFDFQVVVQIDVGSTPFPPRGAESRIYDKCFDTVSLD